MNLPEKIQQEITNYFPKLTEKLSDLGQSQITILQPDDPYKGLQFIIQVLDEVLKILQEINTQYALLEEQLQKQESECRNHIRTEQRLKLHCENIQELYEESIKIEKDNKAQIANLQQDNIYLKKEIENFNKQIKEKSHTKTQSMVEKFIHDHQQTSHPTESKQKLSNQTTSYQFGPYYLNNNFISNTIKQNQLLNQKLLNRKNRLITEYDGQTISKQSIDERQYSSLEKIQDYNSIYSRPKSRINQDNIQRKANTIHISQQFARTKSIKKQ